MPIIEKNDCANQLLRRLPDTEFAHVAGRLLRVELNRRHVLITANKPIETVYFLESGIASIVMTMPSSGSTEVGIFGREGFSGTPLLLGVDRSPHDTFMQVDGVSALQISAADFQAVLEQSPTLRTLLLRYVQTALIQSAANTAANAHLRVEARLARWLLMCHDRIDGDDIRITHEFMAMMIAAQRTRVTMTLHILEGTGAIQASRGRIKVTDRKKLEQLAGDAYGHAEAEYRRVIGPFGRAAS
jgi:CRP-like cAMP-binding protein